MKNLLLLAILLSISFVAYAHNWQAENYWFGDDISGGDSTHIVVVDGLKYKLYAEDHSAMVANGNSWEGELSIPEYITYEGENYIVNALEWIAFKGCTTLTKVRIPKTITDIRYYVDYDAYKNPFSLCSSLERIDVDEDNPYICSLRGVLFNKDKTQLYSYPVGAKATSYMIPDGVICIGYSAFCSCESLRILDVPQSIVSVYGNAFKSTHLDILVLRGTSFDNLTENTFSDVNESMVIYAQSSMIPRIKEVFSGTVLPLEDFLAKIASMQLKEQETSGILFDLQGRPIQGLPKHGMYIQNGKKVMR